MKKLAYIYLSLFSLLLMVAGVTYAAFVDTANLSSSTFSIGSADIKFWDSLTAGTDMINLLDEKNGPSFSNISPAWSEQYLLKLYNSSPGTVQLQSYADYITAEDPDDLRQLIYVEPVIWNDKNNDGQYDEATELVQTFPSKTFVKWKTEGYQLGNLASGESMGLVLNFSTLSIPETRQGKTGSFDFKFLSEALN